MTAVAPGSVATRPYPARPAAKGSYLLALFRETDPKKIGVMYLVTAFAFFMIGGAMAVCDADPVRVPPWRTCRRTSPTRDR
jgi:cytochrome c oxidase subunit 1